MRDVTRTVSESATPAGPQGDERGRLLEQLDYALASTTGVTSFAGSFSLVVLHADVARWLRARILREEQPAPATPSDSEKAASVGDERTEERRPRTLDELCEEDGALGRAARCLRSSAYPRTLREPYTAMLDGPEARALADWINSRAGVGKPVAIWRHRAEFLWGLLDDIDTEEDACKGDDAEFRRAARALHRRRFESARSPDGHRLEWLPVPAFPAPQASEGQEVERIEGWAVRENFGSRDETRWTFRGGGKRLGDWWRPATLLIPHPGTRAQS